MVLSFAKCGVILHFLISWGWKWRIPVHTALAPVTLGLAQIYNSNAQALRNKHLEDSSQSTRQNGSSWVSDGRTQQGAVGSSSHQAVSGISPLSCSGL